MASLDYASARKEGYTDQEIQEFLAGEQAKGHGISLVGAPGKARASIAKGVGIALHAMHPEVQEAAKAAFPLLGMAGGGIVGAPLGPFGTIGGASMGAGVGQEVLNRLSQNPTAQDLLSMGPQEPEQGVRGQEIMGAFGGAIEPAAALMWRGAGPAGRIGGKMLSKVPVVGPPIRAGAKQLIKEIAGTGEETVQTAMARRSRNAGPKPNQTAASRVAESKAAVIKPTPEPAPITEAPKPVPKTARAPKYKPRGASSPELARRTAARSRATGKTPPAESTHGTTDLEALLKKSISVEHQFNQLGLGPVERALLRTRLR